MRDSHVAELVTYGGGTVNPNLTNWFAGVCLFCVKGEDTVPGALLVSYTRISVNILKSRAYTVTSKGL